MDELAGILGAGADATKLLCWKILLTSRSLPFEMFNPNESRGDDKIGGCSGGRVVVAAVGVAGAAVSIDGSGADRSRPSRSSRSWLLADALLLDVSVGVGRTTSSVVPSRSRRTL